MRRLCWLAFASIAAASALPAQAPGLTGRWSQSSNGKELVLAPRVKLVPNVGVTAGTNLSGSTGYGSLTRTTIVTEPVMMPVARSMTLAVDADGRFRWTIVRRHAEKQGCTITTTQVKQGRVSQAGAKLDFAIAGGTGSFTTSCGRRGSAPLPAATERYDIQPGGNGFVLSGGASRWAFRRR
ncbi:hypothetical protein [Sphingosinicella sp. BN140058]|uniref:hypothetical protein n=1 Tax=Sphingosinicella sp. BN140058 TaxID=1892855 RepID=UPI001010F3B8|nr:hypothetical protein [Sphingosinicella sp. BN140058]QAY75838.1 hypothetical protein ETR14_04295 [Sphingosinicella sp. BN140058]